MKLKNILLSGLSLVLVAALAIGGTVAYLQDDDSDVNVMTLGNVSIAQHEYERVVENGEYKIITVTKADGSTQESYELKEFTQAKPLLPAVGNVSGYTSTYVRFEQLDDPAKVQGGQQFLDGIKNAQDKIVLVENTGKTDSYVRTLIAFEAGSLSYDELGEIIVKSNGNNGEPWKYTDIKTPISINGNNYIVVEAIYTGYSYGNMRHQGGILPAGEWTYNNLTEVYMKSTATNEDVEAIDGNKNGTYDILVLSQAVQTAGFADAQTALDTAFGKTAENAADWFGGVAMPELVDTVEELQAAIDAAQNGDTIVLGADIEGDVTVTQKADVKFTIDGNGKTIKGTVIVNGKSQAYATAGVTIKNVNFDGVSGEDTVYIKLGAGDNNTRYTNNVTVSGCTFSSTGNTTAAIKSYTGGDKNLTVENCTVNAGMHSFLQLDNVKEGLTVTDCKVYSKNGININSTPYLNMSGCEFDTVGYCVRIGVKNTTNNGNFTIAGSTLKSANDDGDAVIILRGTMTDATLNIKGTTLTAANNIEITGTANIVK